jgi:threonine dehydrogenase-like Zn-dependent dehydrogenase
MDVWIIGAGRFGLRALCKLRNRIEARYVIVDRNPMTCEDAQVLAEDIVCRNGIDYLSERLKRMGGPKWIVPAVPVHLVFEWLRRQLDGVKVIRPMPVPLTIATGFPNPMRGKNGELYLSNADFMCPANCTEPDLICSYTGKARPCILYQELRDFRHDRFRSIVVRSRQLAPGVGGYTPQDLFNALDQVLSADGPVLMSTACKCHGVMNAFSVESVAGVSEAADKRPASASASLSVT